MSFSSLSETAGMLPDAYDECGIRLTEQCPKCLGRKVTSGESCTPCRGRGRVYRGDEAILHDYRVALAAARAEGRQDRTDAIRWRTLKPFLSTDGDCDDGTIPECWTGIVLRDEAPACVMNRTLGPGEYDAVEFVVDRYAARTAVAQPETETRFDTGNRDMDRALAADDAKLEALGAYDAASVPQEKNDNG